MVVDENAVVGAGSEIHVSCYVAGEQMLEKTVSFFRRGAR